MYNNLLLAGKDLFAWEKKREDDFLSAAFTAAETGEFFPDVFLKYESATVCRDVSFLFTP